MTWETIDTFLQDVARAAGISRNDLMLVREVDDRGNTNRLVVTEDNWNYGYLKPDEGYGSRLQRYIVQDGKRGIDIASWGLFQFPSCCAFCVSTQAWVHNTVRNRGINKLSNVFRQKIARHENYTALVCTDVKDNEPERRTLAQEGFKDIYEVRNKRTGNQVVISIKTL